MITKKANLLSWILQVTSALIMLQTLFFKFSASEESLYIFTKLNMEPEGRIGTGIVELISSLFLLIPSSCWLGAVIAACLMSGAIYFHLTSLGLEIMDDGGYLFILACIVFLSSIGIFNIRRKQVWIVNRYIN